MDNTGMIDDTDGNLSLAEMADKFAEVEETDKEAEEKSPAEGLGVEREEDAESAEESGDEESSEVAEELKETSEEHKETATEIHVEGITKEQKADLKLMGHIREVAEKNPSGFNEAMKRAFPNLSTSHEIVELNADMLDGSHSATEIMHHFNEVLKSRESRILEGSGLGEILQSHEEKRLEGKHPEYKNTNIKVRAKAYQKEHELDPAKTLKTLMIKAAAYDCLGDISEMGAKTAEAIRKQKLAAVGAKGAAKPPAKAKDTEEKKSVEQRHIEDMRPENRDSWS